MAMVTTSSLGPEAGAPEAAEEAEAESEPELAGVLVPPPQPDRTMLSTMMDANNAQIFFFIIQTSFQIFISLRCAINT